MSDHNIRMINTLLFESKVTEIYCMNDDFCKKFTLW